MMDSDHAPLLCAGPHATQLSRRQALKTCVALGATTLLGMRGDSYAQSPPETTKATLEKIGMPTAHAQGDPLAMLNDRAETRTYHASMISLEALEADASLVDTLRAAGLTDLWSACFAHGHWLRSIDEERRRVDRMRAFGFRVHQITIPLGHPAFSEKTPDYMPDLDLTIWRQGIRPDGVKHYGVSIHAPAIEENVEAVRRIKTTDPGIIFLDDDFRLAPSPTDIGGCFCEEHRERFLTRHGWGEGEWQELLRSVQERRLTPVLRAWVGDTCDELTACFRAQQKAAAPEAALGIMVMYLGSEKSGIRLDDYRDVPFRVGELMFNDGSFAPVKGKTDELFSALFHRRFVRPELAFSETTAWPPTGLSARNMAAKLAVSTITDTRNTMFMSGATPFPDTHWPILAPAMRKNADIHRALAGHRLSGPFKHYWGEASRWVGGSNPYSLFLASGVPFEVADQPPTDGWTFLSDVDARDERFALEKAETTVVARSGGAPDSPSLRAVPEHLDRLFALKRGIIAGLKSVPYVEEDTPVVCAWYPTANAVLLWNLTENRQELTVRLGILRKRIVLEPLDLELVRDIG